MGSGPGKSLEFVGRVPDQHIPTYIPFFLNSGIDNYR